MYFLGDVRARGSASIGRIWPARAEMSESVYWNSIMSVRMVAQALRLVPMPFASSANFIIVLGNVNRSLLR